jgi:hypothetical protein
MLPTLLVVAIVLGTAAILLRVATGLGRTLLVAGLVAGSTWLLAASAIVIYQRGRGLLLLVLIVALAAAVAVYRRLGAIQAIVVGLGIIAVIGIALA